MIDTKIEKTFAADAYRTTHPCVHTPCCPTAEDIDRDAAHVISARPEQGWSLLCNGVVVFEDFGELLPNGQSIDSRRVDLLAASPHR
ncbi:DUF5999 family protein [Jatrophihabitans endophyticus]|uniref:DUF5999 family protein n=1 Tax=Jatrophihabitans endophyticus TaxID=1206085 RepID=UPI001A0BD809|nr:DUF5999 family protein [Jatrophihabitans endophyticus]MBE7187326.1 hypothetical protein [Jatrophihabitans endophyticus]